MSPSVLVICECGKPDGTCDKCRPKELAPKLNLGDDSPQTALLKIAVLLAVKTWGAKR